MWLIIGYFLTFLHSPVDPGLCLPGSCFLYQSGRGGAWCFDCGWSRINPQLTFRRRLSNASFFIYLYQIIYIHIYLCVGGGSSIGMIAAINILREAWGMMDRYIDLRSHNVHNIRQDIGWFQSAMSRVPMSYISSRLVINYGLMKLLGGGCRFSQSFRVLAFPSHFRVLTSSSHFVSSLLQVKSVPLLFRVISCPGFKSFRVLAFPSHFVSSLFQVGLCPRFPSHVRVLAFPRGFSTHFQKMKQTRGGVRERRFAWQSRHPPHFQNRETNHTPPAVWMKQLDQVQREAC